MKIWYSPPGEISKDGCWVAASDCWLYTSPTLLRLLWVVFRELKQDQHLVG